MSLSGQNVENWAEHAKVGSARTSGRNVENWAELARVGQIDVLIVAESRAVYTSRRSRVV